MRIIIDGNEVDWEFESDNSLKDVIVEINNRLISDENAVISEVKLDDFEEGLNTELTWDEVTISSINQISFQTEPVKENLLRQYDEAIERIQEAKNSIPEITDHMFAEEIDQAMDKFKMAIDRMILVFNLLTQSEKAGIVNLDEIKVGEGNFRDFVVRFNSTLKEITESMVNRDTTLINDFLEYELDPALGDFLDILPDIKDRISNFDF